MERRRSAIRGSIPGLRARFPALYQGYQGLRLKLTWVRLKRIYPVYALRVGRGQEPAHLERARFRFRLRCPHLLGPTLEKEDDRRDYGEVRMQAIGQVGDDVLFVVYTDRGT